MTVSLRPWDIRDAADISQIINNEKILDNLRDGIPFPYTQRDGEEFITAMLSAEPDSVYAFAITVDGKVAGSISVFRQNNIHRLTGELGYYIDEQYWGQGIMTKAVKKMCAYIFENTDIVRIFAEPFANNVASCRVLEKAGFICEGTLKSNAIKNGKILDMKIYALIRSEPF